MTDATDPTESGTVPLDALADAAVEAVLAAGDLLAAEFRTGVVAGEYGTDDVKAEVDVLAEERVLEVLDARFPEHATHGEETGRRGASDHVWTIDPLDGTNNFAADYPSFATATCCVRDDEPVAAAVYEPLPDSLYVATAGGGARVVEADRIVGDADGETTVEGDAVSVGRELTADSDTPLDRGTVSYVVGLPAVRDDDLRERADDVKDALGGTCKRVLETWSPCVDWGLLARGGTEAVVCFHPDPYEQYPGTLLAEESGAAVRERDGLYVAAATDRIADRLFDAASDAA